MVTIDKDKLIDGVYQEISEGNIPLEEDVVCFLLGYYLENEGSDVAFRLGQVSTDLIFSPDVDVLEFSGEKLVGYEVKGVTGEIGTKKQDLYKGLGQATVTLSQPAALGDKFQDTSIFSEAYLVTPPSIGGGAQWQETFMEAIRKSPVGYATIHPNRSLEYRVEPEVDVPERCLDMPKSERTNCVRRIHDDLYHLLSEVSGVQDPSASLLKLAKNIADEYGSTGPVLNSLG